MTLEILVPDGVIVQTEVLGVRAVDVTGSFGLLPGHEDFCAALVPSILIYRNLEGRDCYVAVDGGVLILEDERVSVVTREAVSADDLSLVADAVASILRTREEQEREAGMAFNRLVAELLEQLPQLEIRS
jgi:F-type H+-transporting ATPase subunit epsilon